MSTCQVVARCVESCQRFRCGRTVTVSLALEAGRGSAIRQRASSPQPQSSSSGQAGPRHASTIQTRLQSLQYLWDLTRVEGRHVYASSNVHETLGDTRAHKYNLVMIQHITTNWSRTQCCKLSSTFSVSYIWHARGILLR